MKNIILDGSKFKTKEQVHDILKDALSLPDYYGRNLDALFDCLTGYIELPVKIEWINFNESKINIGEYVDQILDVFKDAEEELEDEFKIILK